MKQSHAGWRGLPNSSVVLWTWAWLTASLLTSLFGVGCFGLTPTITTPDLPAAQVNAPYANALSAAGGLPPYSWSIASGSLPPGVILNAKTGALSGLPTRIGSYKFTVQLADNSTPDHRFSVKSLALEVASLPSIATQPANQTVSAGQSAIFSVVASGTGPFSYQWLKDGAIISGATSASYTTPPTDSSDSGTQFAVVVGNPAGNVNSNHAWLTVNGASHALTASASSLKFSNVNVGSSSTLGVAFKNTENSDITIAGVSISGAGINANGISSGLILNPGQTANLNVTFAPAATGGVTGAVNVTTDVPGASTSITLSGTGVRAVSHSATLAWAPSTASTITGYNLYRATVSGGYTAPLNSSPISLSTAQFTDSTVQAGQTYYYVFTFVDSNNVQSTYSNEVSATIPTQ